MKTGKKSKISVDSIILLCSGILLVSVYRWDMDKKWIWVLMLMLFLVMIAAIGDLVVQIRGKKIVEESVRTSNGLIIQQLILLDDQDRPVKSWELSGKIAVVIGKKNEDEEVDVDLEDCEYSTFINPQHAVLNFCQDFWYIEDLGSQNGIKIKKVEDGVCYKVLNRPCKVMPGDIIFIANTKLLLT